MAETKMKEEYCKNNEECSGEEYSGDYCEDCEGSEEKSEENNKEKNKDENITSCCSKDKGKDNGNAKKESFNEKSDKECCKNNHNHTEQEAKQDKKVEELIETLQRLQAEFENYRKRTENEKSEMVKSANKSLIKKMLPILDNFSLALKNTADVKQFIKGIELVFAQFQEILKEQGIEKVHTEKFNPEMHEAIMYGEGKEGKIIEVFQDGYMLDGRILRPARVKVGKSEVWKSEVGKIEKQ